MTREEALAIEFAGEKSTTPEKWLEAMMTLEEPYVKFGSMQQPEEEVIEGPEL